MPAVQRTRALELFWKAHRALFEKTGGRMGSRLGRARSLLLTTMGRRSGEPRRVMLYYLDHGAAFAVVASNVGDDRQPGWYLNLRDRPEATVQVGRQVIPVLGRDAGGEERNALWDRFVSEVDAAYDVYAGRTARVIPVVVLDRA